MDPLTHTTHTHTRTHARITYIHSYLYTKVDGLELSVVEIDRRKTLSELKRRIQEVYPCPLLTEESRTLSLAKHLPAGLHIGQELKGVVLGSVE